jgi:hypothetical protein
MFVHNIEDTLTNAHTYVVAHKRAKVFGDDLDTLVKRCHTRLAGDRHESLYKELRLTNGVPSREKEERAYQLVRKSLSDEEWASLVTKFKMGGTPRGIGLLVDEENDDLILTYFATIMLDL